MTFYTKSIRICMLVTTDVMYDGRVQKETKSLADAGHQVHVLYSFRKNSLLLDSGTPNIYWHPIRIISENLPKHPIILLLLYLEFSLRAIIAVIKVKPSVIHAHDLDTLLPAYIASRLTKAFLVYDAHELWTERVHVPFRGVWRFIQDRLIPKTNAIIAVNPERAKIIVEEYGATVNPVVVQNCPELQSVSKVDSRLTALLLQYGIESKKIVLYHGALNPGRFLEELVLSTQHYPDNTILVMLGHNDKYRHELLSIAREARVENKVVFLSPVPPDQLVSVAAGADIGIVFYENSCRNNYFCAPNKLYEYLMAGLPVIVNDLPGMANLVRHYDLGRVIEADVKPDDIGRAVSDLLLNDSTDLLDMRDRAIMLATSQMNWPEQAKALIGLYDTFTTGSARSRSE